MTTATCGGSWAGSSTYVSPPTTGALPPNTTALPRVGVIGGAGHFAANNLADRIIRAAAGRRLVVADTDLPDVITWNVSSPATSPDGVVDCHQLLSHLTAGAEMLSAAGADLVVVACNAAHVVLADLRAAVDVEVFDMVTATADTAVAHLTPADRLGPVAVAVASSTWEAQLYQTALAGHEVVRVRQRQVDELIVSAMAGQQRPDLLAGCVGEAVASGAGTVVLGCTELSLHRLDVRDQRVVDCVDVVASAVAERLPISAAAPAVTPMLCGVSC